MDKRKKIMIGVLVALVIVAFVLWPSSGNAMDKMLEPEPDIIPDNNSGGTGGTGGTGTTSNPTFPLKRGSRGQEVKNLQEIINFNDSSFNQTNGVYLVVDGVFGAKTEERVLKIWLTNTVSKPNYDRAIRLRNQAIPVQSLEHETFPLRLGSNGPKVEALNVALGVYVKGHAYSKNFTAKTLAAVKARMNVSQLNLAQYNQIVR